MSTETRLDLRKRSLQIYKLHSIQFNMTKQTRNHISYNKSQFELEKIKKQTENVEEDINNKQKKLDNNLQDQEPCDDTTINKK